MKASKLYTDDNGIVRFNDPGAMRRPDSKCWFNVDITRTARDSKGSVVKRDKQTAHVFSREGDAVGFACKQCPCPLVGFDGEVLMHVHVSQVKGEDGI